MAVFQQLGLLIRQNLLERRRNFGLLTLEVIWPILLFAILIITRDFTPAKEVDECIYETRSLPSEGVLPFMQSYVCSSLRAKPKCLSDDPSDQHGQKTSRLLGKVENSIIKSDGAFIQLPQVIREASGALAQVSGILSQPAVQLLLTSNATMENFFKDPVQLKDKLVNVYNLSPEIANAIMTADLNIAKASDLFSNAATAVCGKNGTGGGLSQFLLPKNSTTSIDDINTALCSIPEDQVSQFVDELIGQINTDAIFDMATNLMGIISPDADTIMTDIKDMADIVGNLETIKALGQAIPATQDIVNLGIEAFDLIQRFDKLVDLDKAVGIGKILNNLDPIITQMTNNSSEWQAVKRGVESASRALSWVKNILQQLPNVQLTFGNLYTDGGKTVLEHLNNTLENAQDVLEFMRTSTISMEKLMDFQRKLKLTLAARRKRADPQTESCELMKAYFDIFIPVPTADPIETKKLIDDTVSAYCQSNATWLAKELGENLDVSTLITEIQAVGNSASGTEELNLESLIRTAFDIYKLVIRMKDYFSSLGEMIQGIATVDLQQFTRFSEMMMSSNTSQTNMIMEIASLVDTVEAILRTTPVWRYMEPQIIIQNLYTELVATAVQIGIDITNQTHSALHSDKEERFSQDLWDVYNNITVFDHVVTVVMKPANLRSILENVDGYMSEVCSDITGALELIGFSSSVEQQIYRIVCDGEFPFSGLTESMKQHRIEIKNKINSLVAVHGNFSLLADPKFQSYASMSLLMKYQLGIQESIGDAVQRYNFNRIRIYPSSSNITAYWSPYYIGYRISAALMEVLGPAIEKSEGWRQAGPFVASMNTVIEYAYHSMDRSMEFFSLDHSIGRTLDFFFTHGPEITRTFMMAMMDNTKSQYIVQNMMTNPMSLLCDDDVFLAIFPSSQIDFTRLKTDMCAPGATYNMTQYIMTFSGSDQLAVEVMGYFNTTKPIMLNFVEMAHNMVNLPLSYQEGQQKMIAHFVKYDWNQWSVIMQSMFSNGMNTSANTGVSTQALVNTFNALDMSMANVTEWRVVKHIINVLNVAVSNTNRQIQDMMMNGITLDSIFINSTNIKKVLILQAKINPEVMDAFFNTIVDPKKVLITLASTNFTGRTLCNGIRLTDFMNFANLTMAQEIESQLCAVDWDELMREMNSQIVQVEIQEAIMPIIMHYATGQPLENIAFDPQVLDDSFNSLMSQISNMSATRQWTPQILPDIPEFMIGVNKTAERTLIAIDRIQQTDIADVMKSLDGFTDYLKNGEQRGNLFDQLQYAWFTAVHNLNQQYSYLKAFLQQARAISDKSVIRTSDFIMPGELAKLLAALEYSPELTETVLFSVVELLKNPGKIAAVQMTPDLLDIMCNNLTVYQHFFTLPPNTTLTATQVQHAMCSFRPNVTLLIDQILQTWDGAQDLVDLMANPDISSLKYGFEDLYKTQGQLQTVIAGIFQNNVTFRARFLEPQLWSRVGDNFQVALTQLSDFTGSMSQMEMIELIVGSVLPTLDAMLATGDFTTRSPLKVIGLYQDLMIVILQKHQQAGWQLDDAYTNQTIKLRQASQVLNDFPDYMEIAVFTVLDGSKLQQFIQMLASAPNGTSFEYFCNLASIDKYFVVPEGNTASLTDIQNFICHPDIHLETFMGMFENDPDFAPVIEDFKEFRDINRMYSLMELYTRGRVMYGLIDEAIQHLSNLTALREVIQYTRWDRVIRSIDDMLIERFTMTPNTVNQWAMMLGSIGLEQFSPDVSIIINTATKVGELLLQKLTYANTTVIELENFFPGMPETQKVLQLLNFTQYYVEIVAANQFNTKFQAALISQGPERFWESFCSIPDMDKVLVVPVNSTANLTVFKSTVCSINFTIVGEELRRDIDYDQFVRVTDDFNTSIDWVKTVSVFKQLTDLVQSIQTIKPTIKSYPWLDEASWKATLQRVQSRMSNQWTDIPNMIQTNVQSILQLVPVFEQDLINDTDSVLTLMSVQNTADIVVNMLESMIEKKFDVVAWLESRGNDSREVLEVIEDTPALLDTILQTSLDPEIMAPFIKMLIQPGVDAQSIFCSMDPTTLSAYFIDRGFTQWAALQSIICKLTTGALTDLMTEVYFPADGQISNQQTDPQNFSLTLFITSMGDLATRGYNIMNQLPKVFTPENMENMYRPWMNETLWAQPFINFWHTAQSQPFDAMKIFRFQQAIGITNSTMALPQLNMVMAIMDVVIEKLEKMNVTEIDLDLILNEAPQFKDALENFVLPHLHEITEVFMAQTNAAQKMQPLFMMNATDALQTFCNSPASTYLNTNTQIDVENLKTKMCSLNFTALANEVMSNLQIQHIINESHNQAPVDMNAVIYRITRLNELITSLIVNPPRFVLDVQYPYLNASVWLDILMRAGQKQMNIADGISQMLSVFTGMFGTDPEFNRAGLVLQTLLSNLRQDLQAINDASLTRNITIGDIFSRNQQLSDYMKRALELSPDMYGLLQTIQVKNPGDFQIMVMSKDPQANFCNETHGILRYVEVPAVVNISAVELFVCSTNFSVLIQDLSQKFGVDQIMTDIQTNKTADWSRVDGDLRAMIELIQSMIARKSDISSPFDLQRFGQIATTITQGINWSDPETYIKISESMLRFARTQPFWEDMKVYFLINRATSMWFQTMITRLDVENGNMINIADLFPNATKLNYLVETMLGLDPEITEKLMLASIDSYKMIQLVRGGANLICDKNMLAQVLSFDNPADLTALSTALCNVASADKSQEFLNELMSSLKLDTLIQQIGQIMNKTSTDVFNIREVFASQNVLTQRIASFMNVSQVMFNEFDLKEKFKELTNETRLLRFLTLVQSTMTTSQIEQLGRGLDQLMPLLRQTSWWRDAEPYFKMMNVMSEVGANRTQFLPTVNVTLSTVIRNADRLERLLKDSFAFAPDIISTLMQAQLRLSPTLFTNVSNFQDLQAAFCEAEFPANVNSTAVRIILCGTDFQAVLNEVIMEFDIDVLIRELGMVSPFANSTEFSWVDLLQNTERLAGNLGRFFTQVQMPPIHEFFMYKGNMTEWLMRLGNSFNPYGNGDINQVFAQFSAGMKQLEPLLSGSDEYKDALVVLQIMQNYMDVINERLTTFAQSDEITLDQILMNSTMLSELVKAGLDASPDFLYWVMTQPMSVNKLTNMLMTNQSLCNVELSSLFLNSTPSDIRTLRDTFCSMNTSALMQEIQVNIVKRFSDPLYGLNYNRTSFDWDGFMKRFQDIAGTIEGMVKNPPKLSVFLQSLGNFTHYMQMFNRVQNFWQTNAMQLDASSFGMMMSQLNPLLEQSEFGRAMKKWLAIQDVVLQAMLSKLKDVRNYGLSLNTLLGTNSQLRTYLETVMNIEPEAFSVLLTQSMMRSEVIMMIYAGRTEELCSEWTVDQMFILPKNATVDTSVFKNLICQANITAFQQELTDLLGLGKAFELMASNETTDFDMAGFFERTAAVQTLITDLIVNEPTIDPALRDAFNYTRFQPLLTALVNYDPMHLLNLFEAYGPLVQELAGERYWPMIQSILYQNSISLNLVRDQLQSLVDTGLSLEQILSNRTVLRDIYTQMFRDSTDIQRNLTMDMLQGEITELLKRTEVQELVCNETVMNTLLVPNLPSYIDLTAVLCGTGENWSTLFYNNNYSPYELFTFRTNLYEWYLDEVLERRQSYAYAFALRNRFNPASKLRVEDLGPQIKELIEVVQSLGDIPPQFFTNFNMSYYMPIIEAMGQAYADNIPELVMRQIELLEPLLRNTDFWKSLQTTLTSASQVMKWMNDKLEQLSALGETIKLSDILPNYETVHNILQNAFSPDAAEEFLTLTFQPGQLLWALQNNPEQIFCNASAFDKVFKFPTGTDVSTIQNEMCSSSQNNTLILQRVFRMLDLQKLLQSLQQRFGAMTQSKESPVRRFFNQFNRFLQNTDMITRLMGLFNSQMMDVGRYISAVSQSLNMALNPDTGNAGRMCDSVYNLIDQIPMVHNSSRYLVQAQLINQIVNNAVSTVGGLDEFMCELPSMNLNSMLVTLAEFDVMDISDKLGRLLNEDYTSSAQFQCSAMINSQMSTQQTIQQLIMNNTFETCFKKLVSSKFTIVNDFQSMKELMSGFGALFGMDMSEGLPWLEPIRPLIEQLLKELVGPNQGSVRFQNIFNATAMEEVLRNALKEDKLISGLLNSFLNITQLNEIINSTKPLQNYICNNTDISSLFTQSDVPTADVTRALCSDPTELMAFVEALKNNINLDRLALLENAQSPSTFVTELFNAVRSILDEVFKLGDLSSLISDSGVDFSALGDLIPQIAKLVGDDNSVRTIIDNVEKILDLVSAVLPPENEAVGAILRDVKTVLNGIKGLASVKKLFDVEVPLRSLLTDVPSFKEMLRNVSALNDEQIDQLLDTNLKGNAMLSQLGTVEALKNDLCDPKRLPSLLSLSPGNITYEQFSDYLCSLDPQVALNISLELLKNADIGDLISTLVSNKFGVDTDEIKEMFDKIEPLTRDLEEPLTELEEAFAELTSTNQKRRKRDTTSTSNGLDVGSFTKLVCGEQVDLEKEFSQENSALDDLTGISSSTNETELPGSTAAQCIDIFERVKAMKAGEILWSYIKPVLLGKVLFTPDNEVTRSIISEANYTFNTMSTLIETSESIVNTRNLLYSTLNGSEGVDKVLNALLQSATQSLFNIDAGSQQFINMLRLFNNPVVQEIIDGMEVATQYKDCFSLDRFIAVNNEDELEALAHEQHQNRNFMAAIVFLDGSSRQKRDTMSDIPKHVQYKIRMDIDHVQTTLLLQELYHSVAPLDDNLDNMRYHRGFIQLQDMIDRAIIKLQTNSSIDTTVKLNQMPAPCYNDDAFVGFVYPYIIPVIAAMAWVFAIAHAIKALSHYKEFGLEEMMKIMGLKQGVIFWSWFINNFGIMLLMSLLATLFFMFGNFLLKSNGVIVFTLFVCFSFSSLMFCYMVSAFFSKANTAAAVGVMLYFLSYIPYVIYTQFRESYVTAHHHLQCLISTTAFSIGATYIARLEQMGEGVQWSNINKVPGYDSERDLTLAMILGWMIIDGCIYFLIGWYFRNIISGKFGTARPFYFPFTADYWGCKSGARLKQKQISSDPEYMDLPVGVTISNLKKKYGNGKLAVNDMNAEFYQGQVTAFLGRNGAGKSTTINMLTGIISPSSGSATVNGWNIANSIPDIRRELGYCAQYDMLFDFMTVKEHLKFYASLKCGNDTRYVHHDVQDMLHNIGLWSARNELVGDLSGGMRRRLSVAIAFIGDPKVVILDEPTSSIDPNGRRAIWDVILKYRAGKTIILCTHHLDEADTLGDRVIIMKDGKVHATGSPLLLKKEHGSGYQLFLEKSLIDDGFDLETVTEHITELCPGAKLMQAPIGTSVIFTLPNQQASSYHTLFEQLDKHKESWGIAGYGVSDSSLDEVFQKLTGQSVNDEGVDMKESSFKGKRPANENARLGFGNGANGSSACTSLGATFRKRALHTLKDFKTYVVLLIIPIVFIGLGLGAAKLVPDRSNQPDLQLQPSLYPQSNIFYSVDERTEQTLDMSNSMFEYPGIGTVCMDGSDKYSGYRELNFQCNVDAFNAAKLNVYKDNQSLPSCECNDYQYECSENTVALNTSLTSTSETIRQIYKFDVDKYLLSTERDTDLAVTRYGGWSFGTENGKTLGTVWFNNRAFHSAPSFLNSMNNMILRAAVRDEPEKYGITVHNHPLALSTGQLSVRNALEKTADMGVSLIILAAFSFIPAGMMVYLVLEHIRGEKHLQHIYGVSKIGYWCTSYLYNMLTFLVIISVTTALIKIVNVPAFSNGINLFATFALMVCYAWAILPFMYMIVKTFKNTTSAFFTLMMVNLFLGISLSLIVFLLQFFQHKGPDVKQALDILQYAFMISPQYCLTSGLIQMSVNQGMVSVLADYADVSELYGPFHADNGIIWNFIALAIQGVVFFSLTLIIEWLVNTRGCESRDKSSRDDERVDEDVMMEKRRVSQTGNQSGALVVSHLTKQYRMRNFKRVHAVNDLTFAVEPGQIFGLCGVNGAGKTTTFRMLTGEIHSSDGLANLLGHEITSDVSRRNIGYCPQMNSLDGLLTGRQTLDVYAELKGITEDIDQVIDSLAYAMEMSSYINKRVSSYSGGMKRKLCVAIALLGNPKLIMLDEPTAGMDPVARRTVWNQILAAAKRGSSVLLTSHSMVECEALCDKIGIMLNGDLKCLGTSQHLKSKFGVGYTLKVKVQGPPSNLKGLISFIKSQWPQCEMKDCHMTTVEFAIRQQNAKLGSIFDTLESNREALCIEDYAVFQTTLDQVFIQFARHQFDQIEGSSSSEDDSESTSAGYKNDAYEPGSLNLYVQEEKSAKTMATLDGNITWNTKL